MSANRYLRTEDLGSGLSFRTHDMVAVHGDLLFNGVKIAGMERTGFDLDNDKRSERTRWATLAGHNTLRAEIVAYSQKAFVAKVLKAIRRNAASE